MENTTILILCAGEAKRWNNYLGVPKQLIPINGEPLLDRTVRLLHLKELYDINIISNDERLKVNNESFYRPKKFEWIVETLLSTQSLWNKNTIVLLGDVFFTQDAINTIDHLKETLHIYGRYGASEFTSTPWGEIFALSFQQSDWSQIISNAENVILQTKVGSRGKLWELYRSIAGFPHNEHLIEDEIFISINDFTDDFDFPSDYDANVKKYEYLTSPNCHKKMLVYLWVYYKNFIKILKKNLRPVKHFLQRS